MRDENAKQSTAKSYDNPLGQDRPERNTGGETASHACRMTGKRALMEQVGRMRHQADQLAALAAAIPDNFPLDADAGLWDLVNSSRR